ncbi:hypothetical protein [Hymenobacter sp. YC55]|uniref:alginate O-acetyltransferase AlgX-related protein n=1 Tax=Hymenobacter sp. YC55 TaxID=3034019 RepID=UPI0023F9BF6F|nr:hypothetical protein [Hymenobacter sp. YC55]MDF7812751.1 hypothetical protein [Hymenobacter sp. YC55]
MLIVLILPGFQTVFPVFKMGRLGGYAERAPYPELQWSKLLDSSYQLALEKYTEDRLGFRVLLIRLRNQVAYSFFNTAKANQVLIGKDNVFLDEAAIRSYAGQDYQGDQHIRANVRRLKAVQDTLARRGILLVFAIAPSKANFYPEYHPTYFQKLPRTQSNYTAYVQQMQQKGVNLIDLAALFQQWKDTVSYPLFTRGGIHWSGYGITLAADTLFRYIKQRGHFNLPDYQVVSRTITHEPQDSDDDITRSLNLLYRPSEFEMVYPDIKFELPKPGQKKPSMLLIGDSFGWGLIGFYPYIPNLFNEKTQFWYYNTEVQVGARSEMPSDKQVKLLDYKAEVLAQDVVLLLFNQQNLASFDYGFTATAHELFFPFTAADQARIQAIEQKLKQSPAVQDKLWQQANTNNGNYDQLLRTMALEEYELQRQ